MTALELAIRGILIATTTAGLGALLAHMADKRLAPYRPKPADED